MLFYKSPYKIGFYTFQAVWNKGEVASTRIRVAWVAKYIDDVIVDGTESEMLLCDAVIFQTRYDKGAFVLASKLREQNKLIICDFTDPHWDERYNPAGTEGSLFDKMIELSDCVLLSSTQLEVLFKTHYAHKLTAVVPDRIDLHLYNKVRKHAQKKTIQILWHGSYGNISSIDLARDDLESMASELSIDGYKFRLVCVYDNSASNPVKSFKNLELVTVEWSNQAVIDNLLESDVAINPKYPDRHWKSYKTNNKTITAWALGVPCFEENFKYNIKKALSANYRNIMGTRGREDVEVYYDSALSAQEIIALVGRLMERKNFENDVHIKQTKNNVMVYTAIVDGCDDLKENQYTEGADFIAYMDSYVESKTWQVLRIRPQFIDPTREAKIFKILSHYYASEYEYSLWMDGSFTLKVPVSHLIDKYMSEDSDILIFKHPERNCVYVESKMDIWDKKDPADIIKQQILRYKRDNHPKNAGLYACGLIIRKNNDKVARFNEQWWAEICTGSKRDQWSFAYLARKLHIKISLLGGGTFYYNSHFDYESHKKIPQYYRINQGEVMKRSTKELLNPLTRCKSKKTAVVLLDDITPGILNTCSFRLRNVAPHISNVLLSSDWSVLDDSDVVIYQNRFERQDVDYVLKNKGRQIFILDITEALWMELYPYSSLSSRQLCRDMLNIVNTVVVASEMLKDLVERICKVPVVVIENNGNDSEQAAQEYIQVINTLIDQSAIKGGVNGTGTVSSQGTNNKNK